MSPEMMKYLHYKWILILLRMKLSVYFSFSIITSDHLKWYKAILGEIAYMIPVNILSEHLMQYKYILAKLMQMNMIPIK